MLAWYLRTGLLAAGMLALAGPALSSEKDYRQVVDGVAVYFGIVPAQLVRDHPPAHAEAQMHGGAPLGENHIMVALFEDRSGRRIVDAQVSARVTGDRGLDLKRRLEPMVVAGAASFGNYVDMPGAGTYTIVVTFRLPGEARERSAAFAWSR